MFTKINIQNFGIYKNFEWRNHVRDQGNNEQFFKRLNIIYGRNYSGKTTVSRIFRSFEISKLPENFESPEFTLHSSNNEAYSSNSLDSRGQTLRVYNKDFVIDNLKWLVDETNGKIKPFAIIGEENLKAKKKIEQLNLILGSEEEKKGFLYCESSLKDRVKKQESRVKQLKKHLDDKLRTKANENIKHHFNKPNYNIKSILKDIDFIKENNIPVLVDDKIKEKQALQEERVKPKVDTVGLIQFNLEDTLLRITELCEINITPTKPIQDLLNNALLQNWVQQGINLHKDKMNNCGFCQQPLPEHIWSTLSDHFSEESNKLESKIQQEIIGLNRKEDRLRNHLRLNEMDFYNTFHDELNELIKRYKNELLKIEHSLKFLIERLETRLNNIFKSFEIEAKMVNLSLDSLNSTLSAINQIIKKNNQMSLTLENDKSSALNELRINAVNQYIHDIDYFQKLNEHDIQETVLRKEKKKLNLTEERISKLKKRIELAERDLKDEKNAVSKINQYLSHFFGEKHIVLEAQKEDSMEDNPVYQFILKRNGEEASNLSEGESSLIAFCYFLAKLEDKETKGKDLIIWIDDPISSLDSNHIFFVFSLIENFIAKPREYKQLFISTHNLDLLKYLKRLTFPKEKPNSKVDDVRYLMIERRSDNSILKLMPNYLKNYVTEFNYLFNQIYNCYNANGSKENFHIYYNFGNNLRKFLEVYLYYKYPNKAGNSERLKKFFGDSTSITVIDRINNEFSHLEEIFDRSMTPIDVPEMKKVATFVLRQMCAKDEEQLRALLNSTDKKEQEINTIIDRLKEKE